MIDVTAMLEEFAALKKDWDERGGEPPSPEALAMAREFFENLSVVPTNYGAIGIESHGWDYDLSLTIGKQGVNEIYLVRRDDEPR